jgi:hypothetical protein
MWRRVDLVWIDVSEERITSIFRVEKSASEEPAWAGGCRWYVPPKRRFTQDLHGATSQKTTFFIVTAVETSDLTYITLFTTDRHWSPIMSQMNPASVLRVSLKPMSLSSDLHPGLHSGLFWFSNQIPVRDSGPSNSSFVTFFSFEKCLPASCIYDHLFIYGLI